MHLRHDFSTTCRGFVGPPNLSPRATIASPRSPQRFTCTPAAFAREPYCQTDLESRNSTTSAAGPSQVQHDLWGERNKTRLMFYAISWRQFHQCSCRFTTRMGNTQRCHHSCLVHRLTVSCPTCVPLWAIVISLLRLTGSSQHVRQLGVVEAERMYSSVCERSNDKHVLMVLYAPWCPYCKAVEQEVRQEQT